jgi:hypothetical protein
VTAWVAGSGTPQQPGPAGGVPGSTDATRLGPVAGEGVAGYLERVRAVPPGPPGPRLALVTFDAERDVAGAAAAVEGATAREAVFRVPLPRVQTALRRVTLDATGTVAPAEALRLAEAQAANRAGEQARTASTGPPTRAATVAATESARLSAGCPCVLAVVVETDPALVPALAARPGVRAVETAPAGAGSLAVSPLLPEQTTTVGPVPDDGPVPPP